MGRRIFTILGIIYTLKLLLRYLSGRKRFKQCLLTNSIYRDYTGEVVLYNAHTYLGKEHLWIYGNNSITHALFDSKARHILRHDVVKCAMIAPIDGESEPSWCLWDSNGDIYRYVPYITDTEHGIDLYLDITTINDKIYHVPPRSEMVPVKFLTPITTKYEDTFTELCAYYIVTAE